MLEIRLRELDSLVDVFVLVEATQTFTGKPKPLHFELNKQRFAPYLHKIRHIVVDDFTDQMTSAWDREFHQRSAIGRGLEGAAPGDYVIISDVDEIPKPDVLHQALQNSVHHRAVTFFGGDLFRYKLNYLVEPNNLTSCPRMIDARYFIDAQVLRHCKVVKSRRLPTWIETPLWRWRTMVQYKAPLNRIVLPSSCWHFSYMGDFDRVATKLGAFSHTEHNTDEHKQAVLDLLAQLDEGSDGGQGQIVKIDGEMPSVLRDHGEKFAHLIVD